MGTFEGTFGIILGYFKVFLRIFWGYFGGTSGVLCTLRVFLGYFEVNFIVL